MTWTYSGIPSATQLDQIRFLIGDTDVTDQQIRDEEIEWALTQFSSIFQVAALVLRSMQAQYARQADCTIGSISISNSQKAAALKMKADEMDEQARKSLTLTAVPFVGAISCSEREKLLEDEDGIPARFTSGQFTFLGDRRQKGDDSCGC